MQAWNRRDADRLAALFEADAEFVNVTGLWWHDRDAIRRAHDYGLRTIFDQSTISLVTRRVRWLVGGPDATPAVAVVHAKMELEGQADVDDPRPRRTIFTFVVHRTDALRRSPTYRRAPEREDQRDQRQGPDASRQLPLEPFSLGRRTPGDCFTCPSR